MNIKSLLLGSAVAAVAATGARAADAIIIAEPEPMEYVRICDMYGAGFFYIPGTENCLKIGGYMRYEMKYSDFDWVDADGDDHSHRFSKFARFQLTVDARSETELGTLRAYAEGRFEWSSFAWASGLPGALGVAGGTNTYLNQGYIELMQSMGTFRIGKSDTPYARFLGYSGAVDPFDLDYRFNNGGEVSYTFNNGSGFSAIIAAVEGNTGTFEPRVEAGANFTQGWGSIGGIVGYDTPTESWGAKAVAKINFAPVSATVQVLYADDANIYSAGNSATGVGASRWSVSGIAVVAVNEKVAVQFGAQWFDRDYSATSDSWQAVGGINLTPVPGLQVMPSVRYTSRNAVTDDSSWEGNIRFQRTF